MASGFQGGRDIFGGVGGGSAMRGSGPIQVPYQQRPEAGVPGGGPTPGAVGGGGLPKRSLAELQRQQPLLARSVRQKTTALPQQGYPISPVDMSSSSSFASTVSSSGLSSPFHLHGEASASVSTAHGTVPPRNGSYLFLQQQLLLRQQQQRQQGYYAGPSVAANLPLPRASPTAAEQPRLVVRADSVSAAVAMKSRLQDLEKQLLDDDDEEKASISDSFATATEWSETMQNLLSPPSCSASSPKSTLSPSPSSTCSSSSSPAPSCSPPSRQMLLDAASAIADGNIEAAAASLDRLQKTSPADPCGDPEQRLTAHMVAALRARISFLSSPAGACSFPGAELCGIEHLRATRMLHESSPCFYLGLVAANLAILEATRGHPKIHIVDFDIGQGLQYTALVDALAELPASPGRPTVRITAVADPTVPPLNPQNNNGSSSSSSNFLKMVGERIERQAELADVGVRFTVLDRRASDLDAAALGCDPDEALAVNLAFLLYRLPDESVTPENPRDQLLRRVRSLSPRVVTLVEQEMNCNTAPFAARFSEASAYCRALFDSLEATVPRDSPDRVRLEECLARKAANAVAREGPDRVERCEVFGKWRARMAMAGYRPCPLGPSVVEPVRARLACKSPPAFFSLKQDSGALYLGWSDRMLTVTSAWR